MKNQRKKVGHRISQSGHDVINQGPQKALHIKDKLAEKTGHKKPMPEAHSSLIDFMRLPKKP